VALLGKLGIVERLAGRPEIAAAILAVAVEKQRVKSAVEIVMVGDVPTRPPSQIELRDPPPREPHRRDRRRPPSPSGSVLVPRHEIDEVGDRAALDRERAVHIGFAELEIGIEQHGPLGRPGGESDGDRYPAAIAKFKCDATRARDPQIAATDMCERGPQQPVHGWPRHVEPQAGRIGRSRRGTLTSIRSPRPEHRSSPHASDQRLTMATIGSSAHTVATIAAGPPASRAASRGGRWPNPGQLGRADCQETGVPPIRPHVVLQIG
jgi:hypothetical protein